MWCNRILPTRLSVRAVVLLALVTSFALPVHPQSPPAAKGHPPSLQVGAEASAFNTDAITHPVEYGVGLYADFDVLPFLGLEGEGRTIQFNEQDHLRQDALLGGARIFKQWQRARPYGKVMLGLGSADFPAGTLARNPHQQHDTLPVGVLGAGLDYALKPRLWVRADYEYQFWHGYGRSTEGGTGFLNPWGVSVGISWTIF